MARVFAKASTQSIWSNFSAVTGVPLTLAVWAYPTGFSTHMCSIDVGQAAFAGRRYRVHFVQTTGEVRCLVYPDAGVGYATTTTAATANQWSHMCAVFASTTDRRVYLNGAGKATDSTSISVTGSANKLYVGRGDWSVSSSYHPFDGKLLWPAIWNVALTDEEVAALAAGINPLLIRPGALKFFSPLGGFDGEHDEDIVGGLSLTAANSPTWSDDSPAGLIYPSTPQLVTAAAGGGGGGGDTYPASLIRLTSL